VIGLSWLEAPGCRWPGVLAYSGSGSGGRVLALEQLIERDMQRVGQAYEYIDTGMGAGLL
jgi:hypothetical protein